LIEGNMNANNIVGIHNSTGSGPISVSISKEDFQYFLAEVRLTLGATTTDLANFSISIDSRLGAEYDHEVSSPDTDLDLTAVTSFRYADQVPPVIKLGDKLVISWPNTGGVSWGLEVLGG
jgi:hypothetical protein